MRAGFANVVVSSCLWLVWMSLLPAIIGARGVLGAQDAGYVSDVRRGGELHNCPDRSGSRAGGGAFVIRRAGGNVTSPVAGQTRLAIGDTLVARGNTDVRLQIESSRYGRGAIFLAPTLLSCSRLVTDAVALAEGGRNAGYRLVTEGSAAQGNLVFRIDSGAAYIQWDNTPRRRLIVVAGAHRLQVDGTSLGVVVLPDGRALIFVLEGAVVAGAAALQNSRMYEMRTGQAPRLWTQTASEVSTGVSRDVAYHTDVVFRPAQARPFYRHPVFIGVAALGVGYVAWRLIMRDDDAYQPPRGGFGAVSSTAMAR